MRFDRRISCAQQHLRVIGLTLQQRFVQLERASAVAIGGVHPGERRHRLNVVRALRQSRCQRVVRARQISTLTQQIGLANAVAVQKVIEAFAGLRAHRLTLHVAQDRIDLHIITRCEQQTGVLQHQIGRRRRGLSDGGKGHFLTARGLVRINVSVGQRELTLRAAAGDRLQAIEQRQRFLALTAPGDADGQIDLHGHGDFVSERFHVRRALIHRDARKRGLRVLPLAHFHRQQCAGVERIDVIGLGLEQLVDQHARLGRFVGLEVQARQVKTRPDIVRVALHRVFQGRLSSANIATLLGQTRHLCGAQRLEATAVAQFGLFARRQCVEQA